jgi:hypothetical protein
MVNSATGLAASASMRTMVSAGPVSFQPMAEKVAPSAMDQGMGFLATPSRMRRAAFHRPWPVAPCASASARQTVVVITRSAVMVQMAGPAADGPSKATSSGTPMKPVFGNAATSAPKAASFSCTSGPSVTAIVKPTITAAHNR